MISTLPPPPSSPIKSLQTVSIAIGASSNSNTATITSVDMAKSTIVYGGVSGGASTNIREALVDLVLTNATTVTATRSGGTYNNAATVTGAVVEYY